ncbi:hypothetical protein [Micromonospora globbae]|uniref:hypothetical protein n=1 Tax=Micromonospora globbae TaxID=1894969 RepID=UPI0037A0A5F4
MAWEWIGPTATAVVGVAGIAGAVLSARVSRSAQLDVAKMSQVHALTERKRELYAEVLLNLDEGVRCVVSLRRLVSTFAEREQTKNVSPDGQADKLREEIAACSKRLEDVINALRRAHSTAAVLSDSPVSELIAEALIALVRFAEGGESINAQQAFLLTAMRIDTDPQNGSKDMKTFTRLMERRREKMGGPWDD